MRRGLKRATGSKAVAVTVQARIGLERSMERGMERDGWMEMRDGTPEDNETKADLRRERDEARQALQDGWEEAEKQLIAVRKERDKALRYAGHFRQALDVLVREYIANYESDRKNWFVVCKTLGGKIPDYWNRPIALLRSPIAAAEAASLTPDGTP